MHTGAVLTIDLNRRPWSAHRFSTPEWLALALMFGVEAAVVAACLAVASGAIQTAIFTGLLAIGTVLFVGCLTQSIRAAKVPAVTRS